MVLDIAEFPDEAPDELSMDLDHPKPRGLGKLHIGHLLQMVLQDAQTRLFFKAQAVIQADIRNYTPKPEDLAYPDKLIGQWMVDAFVVFSLLSKQQPQGAQRHSLGS